MVQVHGIIAAQGGLKVVSGLSHSQIWSPRILMHRVVQHSSFVAQVRGIIDAKGKVGMGVDGSSSNETVNLLDDCRIATYLQRSGGNPKGDF